uniref:RRM domain-containing protein n=1 Tax=Strigamia maritima TaxID=126957 RepID=T1IUI4_STRMM
MTQGENEESLYQQSAVTEVKNRNFKMMQTRSRNRKNITNQFEFRIPQSLNATNYDFTSIYVGNLGSNTEIIEELKEFFSQCGPINRITLMSNKGFAFIQFTDRASVSSALLLNERLFRNTMIKVSLKRNDQSRILSTPQRFQRLASPFKPKLFQKLNLSNVELYQKLLKFVVPKEQLVELGYPTDLVDNTAYIKPTFYNRQDTSNTNSKTCCRCWNKFYETDTTSCQYHFGKFLANGYTAIGGYSCCNAPRYSIGCSTAMTHVTIGATSGHLDGFVSTKPCCGIVKHDCGIYAVDCEMCFTTEGLELTKVSLVKPDGSLAYNEFVLPENRIIDYNTRFSGITAEDFNEARKSLGEVQLELLKFVHSKTILVGHGLENDLRVLKLVHSMVVDTAIVFPHSFGLPSKRSLKSLISNVFNKEIQIGMHDSVEDAQASLELVLSKITEELCLKNLIKIIKTYYYTYYTIMYTSKVC